MHRVSTLDGLIPMPSSVVSQKICQLLMLSVCFVAWGTAGDQVSGQTVLDQIGYTQLQNEVGDSLPDGASVDAALIETGGNYLPNLNNSFLSGKSINNITNTSNGVSGHSTGSAVQLFGSGGVSPGVDDVDVYSADDWINNRIGFFQTSDPVAQGFDVTSHSYISPNPNGGPSDPDDTVTLSGELTTAAFTDLLTRVDFVNARDNTSMFVGSSNGNSNTLPYAMTPAYNAVSVGRTDGNHGAGFTEFYGSGRIKVDIVAPLGSTSAATPVVAAAGALLIDSAGVGTDGARNQVIKATLLAGATKEEFPTWDRTTTRPLDDRFGAGELNVRNSYEIQQSGQQEGSSTVGGTLVSPNGWDYVDSFNPLNDRFYTFEVGSGQTLQSLSIVLSWNLDVIDTSPSAALFTPVTSLTNFDLELLDGFGNRIDASESTVDNVEHIFVDSLSQGEYTLRVSGDRNDSYGLAWRSTQFGLSAIPEPAGGVIVAFMGAIALLRRRR